MRSPSSTESPVDTEGAAARPPRTLEELCERARPVTAEQEDREALLRELSRALEPGEDVRARADVLRLIVDDPWLGGFSGSDGRRVDVTAAQALVALGEPYASGLSPEGRALLAARAPPSGSPVLAPHEDRASSTPGTTSGSEASSLRHGVGVVLALMLVVIEWVILIDLDILKTKGWGVAYLCTTLAPVLLPRARRGSNLYVLRICCLFIMLLGIIPWLFMAAAFRDSVWLKIMVPLSLAVALARGVAVYCLSGSLPRGLPSEPGSGSP